MPLGTMYELVKKTSELIFGLLLVALCSCSTEPEASANLPDEISFNFHIRPILSNNCFTCHGPDPSSRQAGLQLDNFEGATALLSSGNRAIIPGRSRKSELIKRISSSNHQEVMPPPEMNKELSDYEIALLSEWIDQGANWEPYWAFTPVEDPQLPQIVDADPDANAIDLFVLKELEKNQITPSAESDKSNILRRLSYTLTGLPPTAYELDKFLNDSSDHAYVSQVDYYLSSPRFGEHWARHWMDLVRYADTRGHEFDYGIIEVWRYRDYLIRAFNQDIPYDQLIREHLAGDLLQTPRLSTTGTNESIIGTAFFCLSEGKHSPVDVRADEAERIDNIIDVTSKTFQGLTVACAKCHDHKFDPIPTTDYYAWYGMFESTRFSLSPLGINQEKIELLDSIKEDLSAIQALIARSTSIEPDDHQQVVQWTLPAGVEVIGDFRSGGLQDWRRQGLAFDNALGVPMLKGSQLLGLHSGKASSRLYGTGIQGALRSEDFVIKRDSLLVRVAGKKSTIRVIIDNFQLIQYPIYGALQLHADSDIMQDHAIDVSMWKGRKAYIELLVGNYGRKSGKGYHDFDIDPKAWLEVEYVFGFDSSRQLIPGRSLQINTLQAAQKWSEQKANAADVAVLSGKLKNASQAAPQLVQLNHQIKRRSLQLYDSLYMVGVTDGKKTQSPVFIRGNPGQLSTYQVPHRFLSAVSDTTMVYKDEGSNRLNMAASIASSKNPLTARVMVNRIWHHVFGRGLVETVDNFGLQGKPPTHPQLLDHLATRFMGNDWSVKNMIRYMVLSQTFQRSTAPAPEALAKDPNNLYWSRYPVRRLTSEMIRDGILASSGRLDTTMYGPPVPIHLTEFLKGRGRPSQSGPLDGAGRRSVYQKLMRNFLPPMMLTFDMPVPFSTIGNRNVSNVPGQSLTLMNDPFIWEQASLWAQNLMISATPFDRKIERIYQTAFARPPTREELHQAKKFFEAKDLDTAEAWQDYCHSIFNMKEFIYLI